MKKIVAVLFVILSIIVSVSYAKEFTDVSNTFWAYAPINEMQEDGILTGYPDGTFKPNNAITRAEFSKILVLALNLENNQSNNISFEDVDEYFWGKDYIKICSKYLSAYSVGENKYKYYPNQHAMREDVTVALVKATGLENSNYDIKTLDKFKDKNQISTNNRKYIAIAVENNLIKGFDDGTFKPKSSLTRAQVSQLIYNTKPLVKDKNEIITNEDGFVFNKEDLTVDLGPNWNNYVVGIYRASQRHLIHDYNSVGNTKFANESNLHGTDEEGREYSKYYTFFTPDGEFSYFDVNDKIPKKFYYPIPFKLSVPLTNTHGYSDVNASNALVNKGDVINISFETLNNIKEATATLYYSEDYPNKDIILKQYLKVNNTIVIPEFKKKDCMHLDIYIEDEYGNKYTSSHTLYNHELLRYNGDFYSVLSNGIFKDGEVSKITLGTERIQEIKDYIISDTCKLDDTLLDGNMYKNGKPLFVFARISDDGKVQQLVPLDFEQSAVFGFTELRKYILRRKYNLQS